MIDRPDRTAARPELATFADVSIAPVIDIVPPCLDEAAALPWVMRRMPLSARAIEVDNGATNGSAKLTRRPGALVVKCARRGYGTACHTGTVAATADVVALCDGSLGRTEVLRLADNVAAGERAPASHSPTLTRHGLQVQLLDELVDVDTTADADVVARLGPSTASAATWTRLTKEAA